MKILHSNKGAGIEIAMAENNAQKEMQLVNSEQNQDVISPTTLCMDGGINASSIVAPGSEGSHSLRQRKTIPYFEILVSTLTPGEVTVMNNRTLKPANQHIPSLARLKKRFKVYLNNSETFCFSRFPSGRLNELRNMLPYTKTYPKTYNHESSGKMG